MKKESKRVTALTMSVMLMLNITATAVPVSAESGSKVYTHDGYTVEYTIKNEWTGNQNIEVTITNTGDDVLSGWAMGYNAFGEIGGLWNAKIYGHQGTEYILSSAGYNDELAPGQSTNFGYTLTGDKFKIPQNIVNCAERVDITEGYNVYYNITGDYGDTYQAEMVIENLSDTDINAWQLNFDGNASIDNLWNGKLLENNNGSFKVKNAENNSVIAAGGSASFNFSGRKLAEEAGSDVIETSAPATEPAAETTVVTDVSETDIAVGESETESISESEFVTERETVTEPATVIEQESETKTEVVFGNFKLTGVVIPMEFDFEIDPEIDSDEDGLPDYLEKEIGTDRYNADTDGDGLPDGYEYFTLGTDPKKADSDDNGISDADEDFDEDRLTNLEEYELGTDPFSKDTDYDGLSDYDEVKIHNTDPLKYDTDGDKVSDGDEIELGLDPNNPATNGYPDNEYTTKQTVGEDSSALDYINTIEDNPYTVSVEITAAGVAENNLSAGESGYSYSILQNDAVLGVVPELSYSDGLSVTDVVIKFKLDDSAVGNKLGVYADEPEFNGIKRLQVFKYFEDNNILLPIETFYDKETKTVYTHVDELGTYCLMDMEMWINYLENLEPGNYYEEDDEIKSANIAFCLDTRYISDESSFDSVKSDMKAIAEDAFDRYTDVKVYVYYQEMGMSFRAKDNLLMDKDGNNYFTSYEEAKAAIDGMSMPKKSVAYDLVHASNYMIDLCDRSCKAEELDKNIITMYHIANDDNIVGSVNDSKQLIRTVEESAYTDENDEQAYRINVSVICPNGTAKENSYVRKLVDASKGIFYSDSTSEVQVMTLNAAVNNNDRKTTKADTIKKNVIEICGYGNGTEFKVILSTGLVGDINLKARLCEGSLIDSDEDGLSDWDEVNIELVAKYAEINSQRLEKINGKYIIKTNNLPTIAQILGSDNWKAYTENVPYKLMRYATAAGVIDKDDWRILPINSDPTKADSDDDGFFDGITGKYQPTGYYKVADKWPLSSKPHPAFYQEEGEYYFNKFYYPITYIGRSGGYGPQILNLTKDEQKYIYTLCEIANGNENIPLTDPLMVMAICAHESSCTTTLDDNFNKYNYTGYKSTNDVIGYMQISVMYVDGYCKFKSNDTRGTYYGNGSNVDAIIDYAFSKNILTNDVNDTFLNSQQKNVADRFEKIQPLLDKPFINITMGTAKLHQCLYEKGNIYDGLKFYCCGYDFSVDTHSPKEDSLYRDTLANLIGEELLYESETENHNYEFITINNVNVKLPKYKWFYEN